MFKVLSPKERLRDIDGPKGWKSSAMSLLFLCLDRTTSSHEEILSPLKNKLAQRKVLYLVIHNRSSAQEC
ncbi:hypothetical protein E2320_012261 [Naja naja]|nr:hypothetical protein E2320_012261 [Naja naja]